MRPSPETHRSGLPQLRAALRARRTSPDGLGEPLVLPLTSGAGALLRRADRGRLVSLADVTEPARRGPVATALVRRQARCSCIVLVPDRATGIRLAQAWQVDLARVRVLEPGADPAEAARSHLARTGAAQRPWHAG